jgi:hypothetical protein
MLAALFTGLASSSDDALQPAPAHLPPGTISLLAKRTKDADGKCEVFLPIVRGQLGDSLRQLVWGILFAESTKCARVLIAKQAWKKHYKGFLDLEEEAPRADGSTDGKPVYPVAVKTAPGSESTVQCEQRVFHFKGNVMKTEPAFSCSGASPLDFRRVLVHDILPLLVPEAATDHRKGSEDELIIHLRGGDAMSTTTYEAGLEIEQPPCAMYDKIISQGNHGRGYSEVRIIAQDHTNPCVRTVAERNPGVNVTVQSLSREEDAAALLNARHLVVSQSYFPLVLAQMNENLKHFYFMDESQIRTSFPHGIAACDKRKKTRGTGLKVAGQQPAKRRLMSQQQRAQWMVGVRMEDVTFNGPDDLPFVDASCE